MDPYYPNGHTGTLNPVTIDARTLTSTYNVLDNHSGAQENWLRGGVELALNNEVTWKSQVYSYNAQRHWFNNEINAFDDTPNLARRSTAKDFRSITINGSSETSPT